MSNQRITQEELGKPVSALIQSSEESSLMKPEPFDDDDVVLSQPKLQIMTTDSEEVIEEAVNKNKTKLAEDSLSCWLCIDVCCEFMSQCLLFCWCCDGCGECIEGCCACAECCSECGACCSGV